MKVCFSNKRDKLGLLFFCMKQKAFLWLVLLFFEKHRNKFSQTG